MKATMEWKDKEAQKRWEEAETKKEEDTKTIKELFKSLGIDLVVDACGCCDGPFVSITYQGNTLEHDRWNIDTRDPTNG